MAASVLSSHLVHTWRLYSRGEIFAPCNSRSLLHQSVLTAFASCLSIALASAKAIGPAIIKAPIWSNEAIERHGARCRFGS